MSYKTTPGFNKDDINRIAAKSASIANNASHLQWDQVKLAAEIEAVMVDEIQASLSKEDQMPGNANTAKGQTE